MLAVLSLLLAGAGAGAAQAAPADGPVPPGPVALDNPKFSANVMAPLQVTDWAAVEAEPVIRAALPDANVPTSVRRTGVPVVHGSVAELASILDGWLAAHDEGTACVIGNPTIRAGVQAGSRVRSSTPVLAKGLEFDLVVLVDPDGFGGGVEGAVDRYVAMTRATRQLVVLTSP